MKNPLLKAAFAALSAIFLLASCKEGCTELQNLELGRYEFAITHLSGWPASHKLEVVSGNGDYEVTVDDESVLTAETGDGADSENILITPLKLGKTVITVIDRVTGQDAQIKVSVVSAYLRISLSDVSEIIVEIDDPELKTEIKEKVLSDMKLLGGYNFTMVNNRGKALFVYESNLDYYSGESCAQGTYEFEMGEDTGNCAKFTLTDAGIADGNPIILALAHISLSGTLNAFFDTGKNIPEEGTRAAYVPAPTILWMQNLTDALIADYPSLKGCVAYYYVSSAFEIPFIAPYLINTPLAE